MNVTGLITEYNPFHNGHLYHLEQAKQLTDSDYIIVVMSGDFVQRGAPALYDKHIRTAMALKAGADLVIELPAAFSSGSAEDFASAAIAVLDKLGVVNSVCFGSECGDIKNISRIADILLGEPPEYTQLLQMLLKEGLSFPAARARALSAVSVNDNDISALLSNPNNILGVEYLKALKKRGSSIEPVTLLRSGNNYHDNNLSDVFSSATAIRRQLSATGNLKDIAPYVPGHVLSLAENAHPLEADDFSLLLNYRILSIAQDGASFDEYADVSSDLSKRIESFTTEYCSFSERINQLKTKQYTYTRISRALLHILLNIRTEDMLFYRKNDYISYARVLGFCKSSSALLKEIKNKSSIPLITKLADAADILIPDALRLLSADIYASHIYQAVLQQKYSIAPGNEFKKQLIIL